MLVVDLVCDKGHVFEGWFASGQDLSDQQSRGLVQCPVCGDPQVRRKPSAPHLNVSGCKETPPAQNAPRQVPRPAPDARGARDAARPSAQASQGEGGEPVDPAQQLATLRQAYAQVVQEVLRQTEDVGDQFAAEARRMHQGDTPERPIRGQTTSEEREALRGEGIEVLTLPLPAVDPDSLH